MTLLLCNLLSDFHTFDEIEQGLAIPLVSAAKCPQHTQHSRTIFRAIEYYDCVFQECFIPLFDSYVFISGAIAKVTLLTVFVWP